ncbi:hypothetical protein PsYK624_006980 [Phanerochaete sordida]|uniref:Uncharacterized protein n=1 Tax=Phanerochaete sordida TaxID=48140 RepID=A0A9P3FWY9_9APHY|nr:hypothetical protein PsYK624_006980 [Phanerochaete sordida]
MILLATYTTAHLDEALEKGGPAVLQGSRSRVQYTRTTSRIMHHMASVARRPRPLLAMRGTRKGPHTRTHLRLLQLQLSGE